MKSKGIVIATAAVILLGGLSLWDYLKAEKEEKTKEKNSQIFTMQADQVTEIEISRKEDKIILKRDINGWTLIEPVQDIAANTEVENFIKELLDEKSMDTVKEGENIPWAEYQLNPGYAQIILKDQSGKTQSLEISEMANYENRQFARRLGENKIITVSSAFKTRSNETNIRFRERKLFRGKLSEVERITLEIKGQEGFDLEKQGAQNWVNRRDKSLTLDQNKVREVLTQIAETRISNYLFNRPAKLEEMRSVGYTNVIGALSLWDGDKKWTAEISLNKQQDFLATTSNPAFLVKMESGQWEKFEKMNLASVLSPSNYFAFDQNQVQSVVITKNKEESIYTKKNGTWEGADPKYVEGLFKTLSSAGLKELSKSPQLKSVQAKVQFRGDGGAVLFTIEQGTTEKGLKAVKTSKAKTVIIPDPEITL